MVLSALTTNSAPYVLYVIGNKFEVVVPSVMEEGAPLLMLDRSGKHRKTMKWTVYVDIIQGNKDLIVQIEADMGPSFSPRTYKWNRCKEIILQQATNNNGRRQAAASRWRCFESTQLTYGLIDIKFTLTGKGGTTTTSQYKVRNCNYETIKPLHFCEPNLDVDGASLARILPLHLPDDVGYRVSLYPVANINQVSDQIQQPEYQSPLGYGDKEIEHCCDNVRQNVGTTKFLPSVQVNIRNNGRSSLSALVKICQNAVKYERATDSLLLMHNEDPQMTPDHFQSNVGALNCNSNKTRHEKVGACKTIQDLVDLINPDRSARYKFNLLHDGAVAEFGFDMVTSNITILDALIRFCVQFVHNSMRFRPPKNFKNNKTVGEEVDFLFNLTKDRYVETILRQQTDDSAMNAGMNTLSLSEMELEGSILNIPDGFSLPADPSSMDININSSDSPSSPSRKRVRHERDAQIQDARCPLHPPQQPVIEADTKGGPSVSSSKDTIVLSAQPPIRIHPGTTKVLSTRQYQPILKKLNVSPIGRLKPMREKALQDYMSARIQEISHSIGNHGKVDDESGSQLVGLEIISEATEEIMIYLRGGQKLVRKRAGVTVPKVEEVVTSEASYADLSDVLCHLHRPKSPDLNGCICELNVFFGEVTNEIQAFNRETPSALRIAEKFENFVMCYVL